MKLEASMGALLMLLMSAWVSFGQTDQASETARSTDWPMSRGNIASTGVFAESVGDKLEIDWQFKYPKGAFESGPIVVSKDGKSTVYVAGIDVDVKGRLYAIDLSTGEEKWHFEIEEGFLAPPAWHDGRIYVGDMAGMIYCVDEKGNELWRYETMAEISSGANFYKSMVLFGSQDASLYALDQKTGELKWKHTVEDQIQCGATVAGNRCFLAGCDSKLHIVDLDAGKEVDSIGIQSPTGSTAAVLGDAVLFGTEEGVFFSIDYKQPAINWSWRDSAGATSIRSSASATSSHVVFGARNRKVVAVDPESGEELWTTVVKAKVDGSPIIAGDRVYVGSTDGRLYTLNLKNGEVLWKKQFNGSFLGSPAIVGGKTKRLIVATERGIVYCLKAAL